MADDACDFYQSYSEYKRYTTPVLGKKDVRRFDAMVWDPARCAADMSFLEIGCGTGAFLQYLHAKGCGRFLGIDHDQALETVISPEIRGHFRCGDVWDILSGTGGGTVDRIVALDVLEHFSPQDALRLLRTFRQKLSGTGLVVLKVPNAECPWGLKYQFGDLTHRTAFTPLSMRQLAEASGMKVAGISPVRQGSPRRRITDRLVHGFLSWALLEHPSLWTANFVTVLAVA